MKKNEADVCFRTTIGGQALIEGIMMRGPKKQAIVVRGPKGFVVKEEEIKLIKDRYPVLGLPLIRGVVSFFASLISGMKALMFSAECMPEEEQQAQESKFDKWLNEHLDAEKSAKIIMSVSMVVGIGLAVALFFVLPYFLTGLLSGGIKSNIIKNLVDGLIRICIFLFYMWAVTRMKEIHRVFEYHGAEHKSIFCYEKGLELTVENVRPQPRQHPRCGTSFLFVVMIVSMLVFSIVSWKNRLVGMCIRLLLLPVVVAISYEINRWCGRHDNILSAVLAAPGKALQRLTVYEPDDGMIEVAIEALKLVIPEEKGSDEW